MAGKFEVHLVPETSESGELLYYPLDQAEDGSTDWLCAGNIPGPFASAEAIREFLGWAEPLVGTLGGMDREVAEAKDRLWFLGEQAAGRFVEPERPGTPDEWMNYASALEPFAGGSQTAAMEMRVARDLAEDRATSLKAAASTSRDG